MNYVKINIIIFIVNYNYLTMLVNSFVYLGFNARTAFKAKEKPRREGGASFHGGNVTDGVDNLPPIRVSWQGAPY